MKKWQLRLFGAFHLSSFDGKEIAALGRRDRALLTYLALAPNHRESRERLATLLWSTRGDEQARHSLAQSTATVRKALGDTDKAVLHSDAMSLAVDSSAFDVDVLTFRALLAEGTRESLAKAVDLYSDDLLLDFEVNSEGFDEWVAGERDRLRAMAIDAHCNLASMHASEGDWEAVLAVASRALAMDNLREDAHRLLIRAYAQRGQRALALQQYKALADILESELQVRPDAETEALVEQIRSARQRDGNIGNGAAGQQSAARVEPTGAASSPVSRRWPRGYYWLAGGLAFLVLAMATGVTVTFWRVPELAPAPIGAYIRDIRTMIEPHPLSIAILTFESHGDADAADFGEALSSGITTALSISSEMRVTSRSVSRRFDSAAATAGEIARQLQVRYLIEGSVNKWGDRIVVETGLIDTRQGQHRIWSEIYRRDARDFNQFQNDVTFDVIRSLEIRLTEGEQERINQVGGTHNLDAWLAAARGEKHLRLLTPQDNLIARASYERALSLDPNYAGATEGLAWTYFVSARFGWTTARRAAVTKARELGERTIALDPDRPQAYSLLGSLSLLEGDFSRAVELGERAYSLDPNDSDVAALLAYTLTYTGEPARAIPLIDRAIKLRPISPQWYKWLLGRAYRLTGRYTKAISVLTEAMRAEPASPIPLVELAVAYSKTGNLIEAQRIADNIIRLMPRFTVHEWMMLSPYQNSRDRENEVAALLATGLPN